MSHSTNRFATAGVVLAICLAGCSEAQRAVAIDPEPVIVESIDGTELGRLTLSPSAAERLDIKLSTVEAADDGLVVPSAAVIIDPAGIYWVYTQPEPLVFVRAQLHEVHEEDQRAYFTVGPASGTAVVVTGVPELYGAEFGIGK